MWNIVVDELLGKLSNTEIKVCRDKCDERLYDRIQKGFERKRVGLSINLAKTTIVPFARKHKLDQSEKSNI